MIRLQGLHKFFNKGRPNEIHVIDNVNLDLPERGMVAIYGKSGCGKTTLLNVIGGLDHFDGGQVLVDGHDITRETDAVRNQYIGYVFQNYNLNTGESCFENVADALRLCGMTDGRRIESRVMAALRNVGMEKFAGRMPDTLSGGQQQRIAIARAIVKNPRVILADEPTGNLDESNTVMVMDLLKAIAKEHLVLLVTHEADLVDHYCDLVIGLQDGRVVEVKRNDGAKGLAARDKNDVYLGEYQKSEFRSPLVNIDYYGDVPPSPVSIRVVNTGGGLYLEVDGNRVHVLDAFSEIKLRDGVFKADPAQNTVSRDVDMSALPPIENGHYGRLFDLRSSIKSGYDVNFKKGKKAKKLLRGCMALFAAVVVLMSAVFGTAIGQVVAATENYNHNVFYVYTPDTATSQLLRDAVGRADTGVDGIRMKYSYPFEEVFLRFRTGHFETYTQNVWWGTYATQLSQSLAADLPLVQGSRQLTHTDILITTRAADQLLEQAPLSYLDGYDKLIGLPCESLVFNGEYLRVAGIVESDEPAAYFTDMMLARIINNSSDTLIYPASDYGITVADGETLLIIKHDGGDSTDPIKGDTVTIHGAELKVAEAYRSHNTYHSYLKNTGQTKQALDDFFMEIVLRENPGIEADPNRLAEVFQEVRTNRYYEYWEYYYDQALTYLQSVYPFRNRAIDMWLAVEKENELAIWVAADAFEMALAVATKRETGYYPRPLELQSAYRGVYMEPALALLEKDREAYRAEFEESTLRNASFDEIFSRGYCVSDADYIMLSKQYGETHASARSYASTKEKQAYNPDYGFYEEQLLYAEVKEYTLLHSVDAKTTEKWLEQTFGNRKTGVERRYVVTPDDMFDQIIEREREDILLGLVTMGVVLAILCLCMYFIMRSALLNRIKEVGIYRAIGVSKKNLIFKFMIEAVVLTTLTVLIGYLLVSGFLWVCLGISPLVSQVIFYPWWMGVLLLVLLYGLCVLFGVLPILLLLCKRPSQILAKYDI
ncbi:MAG: macrolide ABC transporter ATP-binding protein/permease [Clostridia bacterium]|nr:macrolide ABC transporter ATP-binding protein/permease [Clostridia bacterium]